MPLEEVPIPRKFSSVHLGEQHMLQLKSYMVVGFQVINSIFT